MSVSRMVVERQKSARAVVAAASTHAEAAAEGMGKLLGSEHRAPTKAMMTTMGKELDKKCAAMVRADEANNSELGDDAGPRQARDEHAGRVYSALTGLREVATAIFGIAYVKTLGLEGATPRDPELLARLGTRVRGNLDQTTPPQPRFGGMCFDATYWTGLLDASLVPLAKALSEVAREAREAEATQVAKVRAIEDYDQVFSKVAAFVSAMLTIGGEPELARRVRASTRRPGQTDEQAEGELSLDVPPASVASDAGAAGIG